MIKIEASTGPFATLFWNRAIDLCISQDKQRVFSADATDALKSIGIDAKNYLLCDGRHSDSLSYVTVQFHCEESFAMAKLAFDNVSTTHFAGQL